MSTFAPPPLLSSSAAARWLPCGLLGSGSFGHVSLALNLLDNSLFAMKSCPSSSSPASASASASSLLNELQILQSLHSPFILRLLGAHFDSSPSPQLHTLFLEYMDGGSLADVLRRSGGKLTNETLAARYTRSILQGLDYLHQNGIVHCDIKSHNVLIGSSGVKIADFGAARRIGSAVESSSMDGSMLRGTPLYMAPEVVQGVEQGPSSDIWSLGCTVVEMLQGRPPWGHVSNLAALILKLGASEESPPLPELISSEAKDFLQLCLQRDPKARPTATELLQHPFVCGMQGWESECNLKEDKALKELGASPRSTLGFLQSCEWGSEDCHIASGSSDVGMALTSSTASGATYKSRRSNWEGMGDDWITVKGAADGTRPAAGGSSSTTPFSLNDQAMEVRRGSEVSLDCAAFLLRNKRRRATVGRGPALSAVLQALSERGGLSENHGTPEVQKFTERFRAQTKISRTFEAEV